MLSTLKDLKEEAESRLSAGKMREALKVYRLVHEGAPLDFEVRLQIGDILDALGQRDLAELVFRAVALYDIKSGTPFRAMAALKRVEQKGRQVKAEVGLLTRTYAFGSAAIGRGAKPAPVDYSAKLREGIDLDFAMEEERLIRETAAMAAYVENIKDYPTVVPPLPIFSVLVRETFENLYQSLELKRFKKGERIVEQGQPGQAVYFIARGEVEVIRSTQGAEGAVDARLGRLGAGSIFGEMALVSSDPRSASVICDTTVDVLELTRQRVETIASRMPQLANVMSKFTRERMISNLLATHPMFKPFDEGSKKSLLGRFTGHEVPSGTIFLEQGNVGNGLYVILQGRAEVLKWEGKEYVKLAELYPGDVAGEMSLLFDEPVSATVRTTTPSTLLFLARELFMPLVDALPELLAHFNRLAEARLKDTEAKLSQREELKKQLTTESEEGDELSEDDVVFI